MATQTATASADYAIATHLDLPYEEAVEKVTAALKEQGFGILTEIDVQATLKKKIDADFRRYVILGSCNPHLAHRALNAELAIGLMLPCNVVVYEEDGGSGVAIADPKAMMQVSDSPDLRPIAEEARALLEKAMESLKG